MTLTNLLAIQRLQAFNATSQGVQRLLAAAVRNLAAQHSQKYFWRTPTNFSRRSTRTC